MKDIMVGILIGLGILVIAATVFGLMLYSSAKNEEECQKAVEQSNGNAECIVVVG